MSKSVSEIRESIQLDRFYTRNEVAELVGCGWANVMEASKPRKSKTGELPPRLVGELKPFKGGKQNAWMFSGAQVLEWRESVDAGVNNAPKVVIPLADDDARARLQELLRGSEFEF